MSKSSAACGILAALLTAGCASKPQGPKPFDACAEMKKTAGEIDALERENSDYLFLSAKLNPDDSAEAGEITSYGIRMESNKQKILSLQRYNHGNGKSCDETMKKSGRYNNREKNIYGEQER